MTRSTQKLTLYTAIVLIVAILGTILYLRFADRPATTATVSAGDFELERQPGLGDTEAPVTVVVFEDFSCPACRTFEEQVFPRLKREYIDAGAVRAYFINFQFLGSDSMNAALAAECVYHQDEAAFWDYKTVLYRAQGPQGSNWASTPRLLDLARDAVPQIDHAELQACIQEERHLDAIERDRDIAVAAGATGTPTVFVNGRQTASPSFDDVRRAVDEALAAAR
jgi:protein-disulfide isomerase